MLLCITLCYAQSNSEVEPNSFSSKSLSISTNIPTWVLGIPSLGISYKVSNQFEIKIDGAFSSWEFKRNSIPHHWNFWNISPQVRSYINKDRSTYLGLQYSIGDYNMSRQQGKYEGGGLTIGKQYYAGKRMLIDLGLTFGYLRLSDRESYTYSNNIFYRNRIKGDSNYWGPTALSIRLTRKVN